MEHQILGSDRLGALEFAAKRIDGFAADHGIGRGEVDQVVDVNYQRVKVELLARGAQQPYLLRVWLFASPVLYYAYEMPEKYRFLLYVNPLGQLLSGWSDAINLGIPPTATELLVASAWAFGLLIVGFLYFVSREREFAVRL